MPLFRCVVILACLYLAALAQIAHAQPSNSATPTSRLVLAHYMPWFTASPVNRTWGWHWTMNKLDPNLETDGKRPIAAHYYPLSGPYDSGDTAILEYQLLLMKLSGVDGVIVDWYGLTDYRDYAILHRNTQRLIEQLQRFRMKFIICYEDQTIPALVEAKRLDASKRIDHAAEELLWLKKHWFAMDNYVKLDKKPVLLSFGQAGLSDAEWTQCLAQLSTPIAYFSQHHRREAALGAFDWPVPNSGMVSVKRFYDQSQAWAESIPVAFPRFHDYYAEAQVHDSWGSIGDDSGATFADTLAAAYQSKSRLIQIATWNDWSEGTMIEPSREFVHRDLIALQDARKKWSGKPFRPTADDLKLPSMLLHLRQKPGSNEVAPSKEQLDAIALKISAGDTQGVFAILQDWMDKS